MNVKKIFAFLIVTYIIIIAMFFIPFNRGEDEEKAAIKEPVPITIEIEEETENMDDLSFEHGSDNMVKFQEKYSMDWDFVDANYLLKIAEYHGGTVEDRAYTILCTLYRVFDQQRGIQEVVLEELYDNDGLTPTDFESIVPGDETKRAMKMILYDQFDNCNGSMEYIEFDKEE